MALGYLLFAAFSGCVAVTALVVPRRIRYVWLLLCSWAFFLWVSLGMPLPFSGVEWREIAEQLPTALPALGLLIISGVIAWALGLGQNLATSNILKTVFLCLGLLCGLGLWFGCKYLGLLSSIAAPARFVLPLGFSFYTLQAAGYAVDIYARRTPAEKNPIRLLAFFCFFPTLATGPIQRAPGLLPQLGIPQRFSYNRLFGSLFRILWGIFKTLVVADNLSAFTSQLMQNPTLQPGPMLVCGLILFALQLYFGLSGWADMATGAAGMLGFEPYENFCWPFGAGDSAAFWSRWMASVLGVFRDIFSLPMGWLSNHFILLKRPFPSALLAGLCGLLAFLLFGLWHGPDWMLWATVTGGLVAISFATRSLRNKAASTVPLYRACLIRGLIRHILTWAFFLISVLLFMAAWHSQPLENWWWRITTGWDGLSSAMMLNRIVECGLTAQRLWVILGGAGAVLAIEGWASRRGTVAGWIRRRLLFIRWPVYILLVLGIVFFGLFPGLTGMMQSI